MDKTRLSIGDCLFEAMESFALKIQTIANRDPDDTGELACLYSGISGIDECVKALRSHDYLSESDMERLDIEIKRLYTLCTPV
ncbi:MAG: hypothetical protein KAR21_00495 [Spirochaetales bacterium]|nr:hypothetical protein [Spirochaetales bacterium]